MKKLLTILTILIIAAGCGDEEYYSHEIVGKWIVTESTQIPFEHISFCEELGINSVFEFDNKGMLYVYKDINSNSCNQEQSYTIEDNNISILEWDMGFDYEILMLDSNKLKLYLDWKNIGESAPEITFKKLK